MDKAELGRQIVSGTEVLHRYYEELRSGKDYQALDNAGWCPVWDGLWVNYDGDRAQLVLWLKDQARAMEKFENEIGD